MDNAAITAQEERSLLKQKVRGVQSSEFLRRSQAASRLSGFEVVCGLLILEGQVD